MLPAQPPGEPLCLHSRPTPESPRVMRHKCFPGFRLDEPGAAYRKGNEEHPCDEAQPQDVPPSPEYADFWCNPAFGWRPFSPINPVFCLSEASVQGTHHVTPCASLPTAGSSDLRPANRAAA